MSAYNNASNKDNIVFAVVDQNTQKLDLDIFPFKDQLRYIFLPAEYARGCAWARSLAQSLYMGEEYFFSSRFTQSLKLAGMSILFHTLKNSAKIP